MNREEDNDTEFGWLEEVMSEDALAWVRDRNRESTEEIANSERFAGIEREIRETLDSDDRIPFIRKIGDLWYNFWQDAEHPRGIWRRTTLESYRTRKPNWETVLDLDDLSAREGERWTWHDALPLHPEDRRCIVALSRGGADADVKREFDLVDLTFVEGGFVLPEAKSRVTWRDIDTLYVGTELGQDGSTTMTESGYPREARIWRRGTDVRSSELLFSGERSDIAVSAWRDPTPGFARDYVYRGVTFRTNRFYLVREDPSGSRTLAPIEIPEDARAQVHREWMLVELRSPLALGETTWPAGALLACRFDDWMAGQRTLTPLFLPTERTTLENWFFTRSYLVLSLLDNVRSRLQVAKLPAPGAPWVLTPLDTLPTNGSIDTSPVDPLRSDDLFVIFTDFLTPTRFSLLSLDQDRHPEILKSSPTLFDASRYEISQHEATSKDGTQIPYFQVSRRDLPLDRENPTLLYGYGGFEVSMTPVYNGSIGRGWLNRGGVYVLANLRGGGEFGPVWHQAALRQNRHRAYEDLAAVAEHLFARGVTQPRRLGAMGGSNGGLLVGNALVSYPHLFGAIVCQVPLLDMRRYHRLLAGASWVDEYGNPDDPEQWSFIKTFSPYHLLEDIDPQTHPLPPVLFYTSTRDDRVHPGHARKMVAKMRARGHQRVFYYENIEGGHGGAATNAQRSFMSALGWSFLWKHLG